MSGAARRILPGFKLCLGLTLLYITLLILVPLSTIFLHTAGLGWEGFLQILFSPRVVASLRLSFGASMLAAGTNMLCGLLVAWVLVRYRFPGRALLDALVDLPFALPTAVAGISLTALYAPQGMIGQALAAIGIRAAFTPFGVFIALVFVGLPFVVRSLQPVLEELEPELEQAAATLGASRIRAFSAIILPALRPSLLTGFSLAFARAIGEYGSVVFISGNLPYKTEIVPLLIMTKLEQYDYNGATALALVMLVISFLLLSTINIFQSHAAKEFREG